MLRCKIILSNWMEIVGVLGDHSFLILILTWDRISQNRKQIAKKKIKLFHKTIVYLFLLFTCIFCSKTCFRFNRSSVAGSICTSTSEMFLKESNNLSLTL